MPHHGTGRHFLNAALARLRAQKPDDFYARADGILYNDGTPRRTGGTPARPADRLGRMPAVRRSVSGRAGGFDLRNPPHAVVVAVILVISLLFGFLFDLACGGSRTAALSTEIPGLR